MTDEQIKHMTNRFLRWSLPENFDPDGGIIYEPLPHPAYRPTGTNLLTAEQAEEMVRYITGALPLGGTQ